ncbi:MAG TPA: hypothetical protein VKF38_12085 [Anaerolineaceae bacterium]|nr:hypothetical protein [Anaerolineaceae bacterium]
MRPIPPKPTRITLVALLAVLASLACALPQLPAAAGASNTPAASQATIKAGVPAGQETPVPDGSQDDFLRPGPLDHLLALHSVQIDLSISRPDGSSRSMQIATDKTGNMDINLVENNPAFTADLPKEVDPKTLKTASELLVVGGKAYLHSGEDLDWMEHPMDDNYPQTLAQELHGMDGPGLWLDILPDGSIQPAGQDTVGGFAADKYVVNGKLENQVISGTLWEEPQSDALVQAELHVPGALLSSPDQPQPGELKITLKAQKVDVPLVTLPPAPPPTAVPTTAP